MQWINPLAACRHLPAACYAVPAAFGPWATALDAGPAARLSTYWRARMANLPLAQRDTRARRAGPRSRSRSLLL